MDGEPGFFPLIHTSKCVICWIISFHFAIEKRGLAQQSQLPKGVNPTLVCVTNTDVPHCLMTVGPVWKQARPGSGTRPLCDRSDEKSAKVLKSEYESFPKAQHLSVKEKKGGGKSTNTFK